MYETALTCPELRLRLSLDDIRRRAPSSVCQARPSRRVAACCARAAATSVEAGVGASLAPHLRLVIGQRLQGDKVPLLPRSPSEQKRCQMAPPTGGMQPRKSSVNGLRVSDLITMRRGPHRDSHSDLALSCTRGQSCHRRTASRLSFIAFLVYYQLPTVPCGQSSISRCAVCHLSL